MHTESIAETQTAFVLVGATHFALIDAADLPIVNKYKWKLVTKCAYQHTHYAETTTKPKIYMHNLIAPPPPGLTTDHKNRNGMDNRRSNLRHGTDSQNSGNTKLRSDNTTGYKGVYPRGGGKWGAQLVGKYGKFRSGPFDSIEHAAMAYDDFAREYYGEFARLNFPLPHESGIDAD